MGYKYLGFLNKRIAKKWGLYKHMKKPILVYDDRIKHVEERHLKEFGNIENILYTYGKLSNIIDKPDYVYYNKKDRGLEYYKFLNKNICVVVRVSEGRVLKVRSWYPVNARKIAKRKKKEMLEKKTV